MSIRPAPCLLLACLAAGCSAPEEDEFDPTARLAELDAREAAPPTPAELDDARGWIVGWVAALRDPLPSAEDTWRRRAGAPPRTKDLVALVDRRDACLGGSSPLGLPGLYLARLANGGERGEFEPAVFALLRDPEPRWRVYGCEVLAHLRSTRADAELLTLLDDGQPQVVLAAASALAQRGDPVGLPLLLDAARQWSDAGRPGPLPYRHHFARYANADFHDDFEAYDAWFTRYPVWED